VRARPPVTRRRGARGGGDGDRLGRDAVELLRDNAARNRLELCVEVRDWREPWDERFDLAVAADVLYEQRNVEPLLERLRELAPRALLGLAGRPYEAEFLGRAGSVVEIADRVVSLG
jgi:predicted nicotinamide N-methyase